MKDYSAMSDFEINKSICDVLMSGSDVIKSRASAGAACVIDEINTWFDFCNLWSDGGPIIEKYGIGIRQQSNALWVGTQVGGILPQYSEKPLRAAMIVFLMMQESK